MNLLLGVWDAVVGFFFGKDEPPIPDWEQAGYHYDPAEDYPQ